MASIQPGDTVFLRGGTYTGLTSGSWGNFPCWLSGTSAARVTLKNYPGEHPILDNSTNFGPQTLTVFGSYVTVSGLEVTSTATRRRWNTWNGSSYAEFLACYPNCRAPGVVNQGKYNTFQNLWIHNTGQGFTSETGTEGLILEDSFIWYNGWQSHLRGHGHGIYLQAAECGAEQRKTIRRNVIHNNFGYGVHFFGVSGATRCADFTDNVTIRNTWPHNRFSDTNGDGQFETNLGTSLQGFLIAGNNPYSITLTNNMLVQPDCATVSASNNFQASYTVPTDLLTLTDNYLKGCNPVSWNSGLDPTNSTESGNSIYGTIDAWVSSFFATATKGAYTADGSNRVKQAWSISTPTEGLLAIVNNTAASTQSVTFACTGTVELRDAQDIDGSAVQTLACGTPANVSLTFGGSITPIVQNSDVYNPPVHTGSSFRMFRLTNIP